MTRKGAAADAGPRVLYLVYWGAAEPLGRALVLPSVLGLARRGARVSLVSFEKPADLGAAGGLPRVAEELAAAGVRFLPQRYHKRPKWPATVLDVLLGVGAALRARRVEPIDVVHARTFVGGLMGLVAARLLGTRLVYHNEGFYPDEQVDSGVWREGSAAHRLARALERRLYASADAIVVLSRRARLQVGALPEVARKRTPLVVVPSAVELQRFPPPQAPRAAPRPEAVRFVYVGSVGLRYRLDRVGAFVKAACARTQASLRVLSGAPLELVEALLARGGLPREAWSAASVPAEAIPSELLRAQVGLHFLNEGLSEHGGSPTKFGEYWAAGLPVVTNPNVSDSEEIIAREGVGVIVREHTDAAYAEAVRELLELLADPALPQRCRRAAEAHYNLERACDEQLALYRRLCGLA